MADVFISYAREDRPRAQALAQALERFGWSVWWDRDIPAGRSFDDVIAEAIQEARCVMVLWSKPAVASDWVREEAEEGKRRGILLPALIEPDVEIPFGFRRIQAADLVGWDGSGEGSHFRDLVQDLGKLLGGDSSSAPPEAEAQGDGSTPGTAAGQPASAFARRQRARPSRRDPHLLVHTFGPLLAAGFQVGAVVGASDAFVLLVWSSLAILTASGVALAVRSRRWGGASLSFGVFSAAAYPVLVLSAMVVDYSNRAGSWLFLLVALVALPFGLAVAHPDRNGEPGR